MIIDQHGIRAFEGERQSSVAIDPNQPKPIRQGVQLPARNKKGTDHGYRRPASADFSREDGQSHARRS
jgi:hypothetical protein